MRGTWLVTGGCGFIGTHLVNRLLGEGRDVRVVDNLEATGTARDDCEMIVGDIRDARLARRACKGARYVVHLAAFTAVSPSIAHPFEATETNVMGTLNYLDAARGNGCEAFVLASSAAADNPISPYGASKLAGEAYCKAFAGSYGLRACALRFSNAYGPYSRHKTSVVSEFARRVKRGEPITIYGDGDQTRDFIHAADIADAIIRAAERGCGGEVYPIGTGVATSIKELAHLVGARSVRLKLARQGEIRHSVVDASKARKDLEWQPEHSLATSISKVIDSF